MRPTVFALNEQPCSGSSVTTTKLTEILELYGYRFANISRRELYMEFKVNAELREFVYHGKLPHGQMNVHDGLKLILDHALERNLSIMIKGVPTEHVLRAVRETGGEVLYARRENILDQVICEIKDCLIANRHMGYPVDARGRQSQLCFGRRALKNQTLEPKAYVDPGKIIHELDRGIGQDRTRGEDFVRRQGFPHVRTVRYEELFAFERDAGDMQVSLEAWCTALLSLNLECRREVVKRYMEPRLGTYHALQPHADMIWNFEEIRRILTDAGPPYSNMLRPRPTRRLVTQPPAWI